MENKFLKRSLIVGIGFLFVFSAVSPTVIGHDIELKGIKLYEAILNEIEIEKSTAPTDGLMDSAWPMYCHDARHTGRSPYAPTGKYGIEKWRFRMNGMVLCSSQAIDQNGTIYVGGNGAIYAVYPNGTRKWRFGTNGDIDSTPALASDGTIYVGCLDEKLYAIYPNGTSKWKLNVGGWVVGSPAIDDNGIIYATSVDSSNICAIYPNGTKKWNYHTNGWVYSSPAVADDGIIYCGSNDGYMYALYSSNGTLKWRYKTNDYIQTGAAIGDDGTVYFGSWDGCLYALNSDGTLKWRYRTGHIDESSPAIAEDGTIYVGTAVDPRGKLYSFNPDGTMNWAFPTNDRIYSSPAIDANGIIYVGSDDGFLYVVNPDGTLQWKFDTGGEVNGGPSISEDGTIYCVAYNTETPDFHAHLFAIEVREHAANLELGEIIPRIGRFKLDIKNTGDRSAEDVEWTVKVDGDLFFNIILNELVPPELQPVMRTINGKIRNLEPGESRTIRFLPLFGLGTIEIIATVSAPDANPDRIHKFALIVGPIMIPIEF